MKEYIQNTVQKMRQERSVTQEELAASIGVSRQTIIAIERGRYTPSVMLALHIAHYFKVPVENLFTISYEK